MKTSMREAFERAKITVPYGTGDFTKTGACPPLVKRLLRVMNRGAGVRYARAPRPAK